MINVPLRPSPVVSPYVSPYVGIMGHDVNNTVLLPNHEQPPELSLPRYINYLADYSGCGFWRILWPELYINSEGIGCSQSQTAMIFDPRWYMGVKCIKVQRQASNDQKSFISYLKSIQAECGFKLIYENTKAPPKTK